MKKNQQYHATKMRPLVQLIAGIVRLNPNISEEELRMEIGEKIDGFWDETKCVNCDASMAEYAQELDLADALLLYSMARIVKRHQASGMPFTEANRVRVSSENIHHTQKCRTTKCSKLGLIAQAGNAHWAITDRGWAALRGEAIPRMRVTFRGEILERPEETTTLRDVFLQHKERMDKRQAKGKNLKNDHRSDFGDYNASDWFTIEGYHDGRLI